MTLTSEALVTQTHGPVLPRPRVLPGLTVRVGAAGAGAAQVRWVEGPTRDEGVTWDITGHYMETGTSRGIIWRLRDSQDLTCVGLGT